MKTIFLLTALCFVLACNETGNQRIAAEEPGHPRDGVLLHITHGHTNPHRVLMPLQMASIMAEDKKVLIYLDIDAVYLVTRDTKDIEFSHFTPLKASLEELINRGVEIYACPGCMKAAGIKDEDLIDGVRIAEKEKFFDFADGRIITLNY
jgi:predicted peroxiredoxin